MPNRRQAIIWNSDGPVYSLIYEPSSRTTEGFGLSAKGVLLADENYYVWDPSKVIVNWVDVGQHGRSKVVWIDYDTNNLKHLICDIFCFRNKMIIEYQEHSNMNPINSTLFKSIQHFDNV